MLARMFRPHPFVLSRMSAMRPAAVGAQIPKVRDLLLKLFESLGPESDVAKKGRRKLSNYMLI